MLRVREVKLTIFLDNINCWYEPHAGKLLFGLQDAGHEARFATKLNQIQDGDCCFILSTSQIVPNDVLLRNAHNVVVHSSDLPRGRGWSPLTWQILAGQSRIVNSLFEARESVDSGPVYLQNEIHFEGHELLPELHAKQGAAINELCFQFVELLKDQHCVTGNLVGRFQSISGAEPTYYRKRTPSDSRIDPSIPLIEQFNLLRVADNRDYPVYFDHLGHRYVLRIEKDNRQSSQVR